MLMFMFEKQVNVQLEVVAWYGVLIDDVVGSVLEIVCLAESLQCEFLLVQLILQLCKIKVIVRKFGIIQGLNCICQLMLICELQGVFINGYVGKIQMFRCVGELFIFCNLGLLNGDFIGGVDVIIVYLFFLLLFFGGEVVGQVLFQFLVLDFCEVIGGLEVLFFGKFLYNLIVDVLVEVGDGIVLCFFLLVQFFFCVLVDFG